MMNFTIVLVLFTIYAVTNSALCLNLVKQPQNASLVFNQTHILWCEFDLNVICNWERNNIPIKIAERYSFAMGHNENESTKNCSLKIVQVSLQDKGSWICHGQVPQKTDSQAFGMSKPVYLTVSALVLPSPIVTLNGIVVSEVTVYSKAAESAFILSCSVDIPDGLKPQLWWTLDGKDLTDTVDGMMKYESRTITWTLKDPWQILSGVSHLNCMAEMDGQRQISKPPIAIVASNNTSEKLESASMSWIVWSLIAVAGAVGVAALIALIIGLRYKRPQHPSLNLDDHLPRKQPNSTNVIREPMCSPDQINDESQTAGCSCRQVMETSFNNNFQHQNNDLYKPAPFHRSADQFQHFPVGCRSLDVTVPNRPFSCHLDHHDEELYIDGMSLCSSPSVKMVKDMSFKGYPLPGLTNITKMPHDNIVMYKESSLGNVHDRLDMRFVASPHEVLCQKCSESLESLYHDGYSE